MTDEDEQAAFRQHMAFNTEAVRGGLFATAIDIMEEMRKNELAHADAILLTAAAEFTAQLWAQVAFRTGIPAKKSRDTLTRELRAFFRKHYRAQTAGAQEVTQQ
jgi:hypothetical protein